MAALHLVRGPLAWLTALLPSVLSMAGCGPPTAPRDGDAHGAIAPTTTAPVPAPTLAPPPPPTPFPLQPGEAPAKRIASQRQGLSLSLPGRSGWQLHDDGGSFLVLDHATTSSRIVTRSWQALQRSRHDDCEREARLLRAFPPSDGAFDARMQPTPPGFSTQVRTGITPQDDGSIDAFLLAFGASGRRCFAFAFTTHAQGPNAELAIADRLALIDGLTLASVELRGQLAE